MSDVPAPLTPPGCDLRDFPHTPIFRARLFGSSFHARANDAEWRAGVTLWLKSWDQVPAGSLPADDIELCRLAELARDLKQWKKVKPAALRGWIACSDGRLYHTVVAEGINNAIEKKAAQRLKTAKARIAALEKRLKEASTDADRAHITEEIRRIQQGLSQTVGKSVTDPVTESKGREGEGKGEGEGSSSVTPSGVTGAASAPPPPDPVEDPKLAAMTPAERRKRTAWRGAKSLLNAHDMPKDQTGAFLGALHRDYIALGDDVFLGVLENAVLERPAEPEAWIKAALQRAAGERRNPNKQEALEASNDAVVQRLLAKEKMNA